MQRSTSRILTTHTGSLPRPEPLESAMFAELEGKPSDPPRLRALVEETTGEVVARQASCGVDIVNDGEFGKPSYATYVKDRLEGFAGESAPMNIRDFSEYPGAESS